MAKASSKPTGVSISRKGSKFTITWTKGEKYTNQELVWSYTTEVRQNNSSSIGMYVQKPIKLNGSVKSRVLTISANGLRDVNVGVRGKASGKKWSSYGNATLSMKAAERPTLEAKWEGTTPNRTKFNWSAEDKEKAPCSKVVYQSVLVKDCPENYKIDDLFAGVEEQTITVSGKKEDTITVDESGLTGSNARIVRMKAVGQTGESAWAYAYHVYAQPYAAKNVVANINYNPRIGYLEGSVSWEQQQNEMQHPIDTMTLQYWIGIPTADMGLPSSGDWETIDTPVDVDHDTWHGSFGRALVNDECLFMRVMTQHDNVSNSAYSDYVIALKANLATPTIDSVTPSLVSGAQLITVRLTDASQVPDSKVAVMYQNPNDNKIGVYGVTTNGLASFYVKNTDTIGKVGAYAFVGSYIDNHNNLIWGGYSVDAVMKSPEVWQGVAQSPTITVTEFDDTTATVKWNWPWRDATNAEISWSDHIDAWESTDQPNTYVVSNVNAAQWNISDLDAGKIWYFKVRLFYGDGDDLIYGTYSNMESLDLSAAPAVPVLTLSDQILTQDGETIASWTYVSNDTTPQSFAQVYRWSVSDNEYVPIENLNTTTAQSLTIKASQIGEVDSKTDLVVKVWSESRHESKFSNAVTVTIATPVTCAISDPNLVSETISVDPETKTGSLVTLNGGDDTNVRDVTSLSVALEPVQAGTPAQGSEASDAYLMKASPTTDFNSEYLKIIGGTVAWNQLGRKTTQTKTDAGITWTQTETETVANGTAGNGAFITAFAQNITVINGHKYLFYGVPSGGGLTSYSAIASNYTITRNPRDIGNGAMFQAYGTDSTNLSLVIVEGVTVSNLKFKMQFFDLTQMLGSTIADYIYSLEQATAGAGVAFFRKLFPKSYYAYNAGELISVKASAHNTVGFNQASSVTVGTTAQSWLDCLWAEVDLLPNTTYCVSFKGASGHKIYTNENVFKNVVNLTCTGDRQFVVATTVDIFDKDNVLQYTSGKGWRILKNQNDNTVVPSFTDVCINLSWSGYRNGEYEPYEKHEYALDSDLELRGIPKLDASNNLYYDGDEYQSDGSVSRRYGIIDLGTLTWNKNTTVGTNKVYFGTASEIVDAKKSTGNSYLQPILCGKYITESWSHALDYDGYDKTIALGYKDHSSIVVYDTACANMTAAEFKTAMNGVYLVYELATSTTEEADAFTSPQTAYPYGTESFTDTRAVQIPVGTTHRYASVYPITGHDEVTVTRTSEQLYDPENTVIGKNWIMGNDPLRAINVFNVTGGMPYRIITSGGNFGTILFIEMNNNTQITNFGVTPPYNNTVTLDPACNKIIMQFQQTTTITEDNFNDFACSISKEYETYTTDLGRTVYGGTYNVVTGELTVDKVYYTVNGSETWRIATGDPLAYFYLNDTTLANDTRPEIKCDAFTPITNGPDGHTAGTTWLIYRQIHIHPTDDIAPSGLTTEGIAELKAWLQAHPVHYVLPLSTPVKYTLTPQSITLNEGTNNVWSEQGDVTIRTVEGYEDVLALKELPLEVTVTGTGNGVMRVERAQNFDLVRPDERNFTGYEGETIVQKLRGNISDQIIVNRNELVGRFDDTARYRIIANVSDNFGQSATDTLEFIVDWTHQAVTAQGTVQIIDGVAYITPIKPDSAYATDRVDIYRLSADRPELIYEGAEFNETIVDPYPTIGDFGGYRLVLVTANGDYICGGADEDNYPSWVGAEFDASLDTYVTIIDFGDDEVVLEGNLQVSNSFEKSFERVKYLGGTSRGYWLSGAQRSGSSSSALVTLTDMDTIKAMRRLAQYTGMCHIRTPEGSNFHADIQVEDDTSYQVAGKIMDCSLKITGIDPVDTDGVRLEDWEVE